MNLKLDIRKKILRYVVVDTNPIEVMTFKTPLGSGRTVSARVPGPIKFKRNFDRYALRKAAVGWAGITRY